LTTGRKPAARRQRRQRKLAPVRAGGSQDPGRRDRLRPVPVAPPGDLARLPGARRAALPDFVSPQLALLVAAPPLGDEWLHELKFDGYRILCQVAQGRTRLLSRNGNDWTSRFAEVASAAADLSAREALIDGEVAVLRPDGTTSFNALQNVLEGGVAGEVVYFVFDLVHRDGVDLRGVRLEDRKAALAALVTPGATGVLRYSEHAIGDGDAFYRAACRRGLEGVVSKRRDAPYQSRRNSTWLKTKCLREQEFVIGGFTEPEGARVGLGALLLGVYEGERLRYVGRVGTGFSSAGAQALRRQLDRLIQAQSPFADHVTGVRRVHWVRPALVAEVAFTEWTPDARLRHPSFKGIREDKDPAEIVRERPRSPAAAGVSPSTAGRQPGPGEPGPGARDPSTPPSGTRGRPRSGEAGRGSRQRRKGSTGERVGSAGTTRHPISGGASRGRAGAVTPDRGPEGAGGKAARVAGVTITHPTRVVYPGQGLTKLKLAQFYESIAKWILPHLRGRPTALVRCPEGLRKACFYQKHSGTWAHEALRRVQIQERRKVGEYLIADDLRGLIGLVQMGILEIHTWNARVDRLEQPDRVVIDLDPDPSVPWNDVVAAARLVREGLAGLGLESFVKTTGGKGLHVVAPLVPGPGWDECAAFARAVAESLVQHDARRFVATAAKAARKGRIFVDYLRNVRGATSIAAYSTRARPGAPVSTPLGWDELDVSLRSDAFSVSNLPQRLAGLKRDPWARYWTLRQRLPAVRGEVRGGRGP
jgi:bifunctional non-homologous end joining protein LigD